MEFSAWALHRYVMHGFLWILHEDHHVPHQHKFEKNDLFSLFYAVPSFLSILFDHLFKLPFLGAFGYGILAYGFAYFFVHEVIIHRRLKFISLKKNWYFRALNMAHKVHHSNQRKEDGKNFGMLIVPMEYYKKSIQMKKINI
tara:strand:- start:874 stop:1299 length:426 start_codon:yes stop_codon:yes gene_type:complete